MNFWTFSKKQELSGVIQIFQAFFAILYTIVLICNLLHIQMQATAAKIIVFCQILLFIFCTYHIKRLENGSCGPFSQ
jgi:hypothetical protein